jgi:hypothetical protein
MPTGESTGNVICCHFRSVPDNWLRRVNEKRPCGGTISWERGYRVPPSTRQSEAPRQQSMSLASCRQASRKSPLGGVVTLPTSTSGRRGRHRRLPRARNQCLASACRLSSLTVSLRYLPYLFEMMQDRGRSGRKFIADG